jgi:SAM-dependent methyltransferase
VLTSQHLRTLRAAYGFPRYLQPPTSTAPISLIRGARYHESLQRQASSEIDISRLAGSLERDEHGIWVARTRSAISYPDDGNHLCFELEDRSFWFQHRNRCLLAVMQRFPPPGVFFDVGGGNGFVSLAVQEAGWPVILVEPGPGGARNAAHRGVANVICATLEDAGFVEGSMPAAGAFDVVEHIQDDHAFLRSLARSLRPDGRLYLTVPAFSALWSQEDDYAGHHRRYTASTLRRLLEQTGFQVEYLTYFFSLLPLPVFLLRTIPYKLGVRRSPDDRKNRTASEHKAPGGPLNALFNGLLDRELARIRSGRTIAFGGSCLAVARKV